MLSIILLGILLVAALSAAAASRMRVSPWWTFLPAVGVGAIAFATSSDVASCEARDSTEALFGFAILIALGLFTTAALTALFDAVSLARRGEKRLAATRLVPLLASAALGFGTMVLYVYTVVACLS